MEGPAPTPRSLVEPAGLSRRARGPRGWLCPRQRASSLSGLSVRGCRPVLGCVPGREALSSGSADAQSKKERRPPTRGQCFIWRGVGAAGQAPSGPPHPASQQRARPQGWCADARACVSPW